jgi:hypothetical protein
VVGLSGHSLNKRLKEFVDNWTEPDAPTDQQKHDSPLPEPWPLEDRHSTTELVELIARYRSGTTSRELAKELGVGKTAIVRLLRRHGVEIRRRGKRPKR